MGTPGIVLAHTKQLLMGEGDSFYHRNIFKGFPFIGYQGLSHYKELCS